jgi:hypothetical protein
MKTLNRAMKYGFMAATAPAHAELVSGQCLSMAEMNAALKAEGQKTMIVGDRAAVVDEGKPTARVQRWVNTVTLDIDGNGYQLEGDRPSTEASSTVCIRARLANGRLLDARRDGVPTEVMLGGEFNDVMRRSVADGTRPMVVADTVLGSGTTERRGLPIVVLGRLHDDNRPGLIAVRRPTGESEMLIQMQNLQYTSAGISRLDGTQVAALSPSLSGGGR